MSRPLKAHVVMPAFNAAGTIMASLASLERALAAAQATLGLPGERLAVTVVDDCSGDGTADLVASVQSDRPWLHLLRRDRNGGAAAARNQGAAARPAEVLFFLDADDQFLPDHLPVCLGLLDSLPGAAWVKTGVQLPGPVHPTWRRPIENSLPINLAVRAEAHALLGGYPEGDHFRAREDAFYNDGLRQLFTGFRTDLVTVAHSRRPGNAFDSQASRFQEPFGSPAARAPDAAEAQGHLRRQTDWEPVVAAAARRLAEAPGSWLLPPRVIEVEAGSLPTLGQLA